VNLYGSNAPGLFVIERFLLLDLHAAAMTRQLERIVFAAAGVMYFSRYFRSPPSVSRERIK
jgi:hypothetical protein